MEDGEILRANFLKQTDVIDLAGGKSISTFLAGSQRVNVVFPKQRNQLRSNYFSLELALTKFCRSIMSVILFLIKS